MDKRMGKQGLSLLTELEGERLTPYDDQTGKAITEWCKGATIGVGHLILKDEWDKYKNGITKEESTNLLKKDVRPVEDVVNKYVTAPLFQNQFDALVIFAFNIGNYGFRTSSALRLINDPEAKTSYPDLESSWKAWNKSQGKVMEGLKKRRNREWEEWCAVCINE